MPHHCWMWVFGVSGSCPAKHDFSSPTLSGQLHSSLLIVSPLSHLEMLCWRSPCAWHYAVYMWGSGQCWFVSSPSTVGPGDPIQVHRLGCNCLYRPRHLASLRILFLEKIFFMCGSVWEYVHMNTVPAATRTWDVLELEFQAVVSYVMWVLRDELRLSARAGHTPNC